MRQRFLKEVASAGLPAGPGPSDPITEAELAALPEAAQRYLRSLFAPSMLLAPDVGFAGVDGDPIDLTLVNRRNRVSARVTLAEDGSPCNFTTTRRFCQDPGDRKRLLRTKWTTAAGRRLPAGGEAVWHLPQGDFPYARFDSIPESAAFNVAPGAWRHPARVAVAGPLFSFVNP
jgi:hypothetical protein